MRHRGRRFGAILASLSLIASLVVGLAVTTAGPAAADTTQSNGCQSSVTGGWSTFPIPITGTASPNPVDLGQTTTLSGTSVTIVIDATLVSAGAATGILQPGANYVYAKAGLRIAGTNTSPATQTATGAAKVNFTVIDNGDGTFSSSPSPVVGNIALADTTWTATGGNISLAEATGPLPASLTAPTPAERSGAPLVILTKIQGTDAAWPPAGAVSPDLSTPAFPSGLGASANFYCWPGAANPPATANPPGTGTAPNGDLVPGAASAISSVTVNTPPTAPVCTPASVSVGGNQSTTIDLTTVCSDVNGNNTIDWTTLGVGFGNPASPTICTAYPCTLPNGTLDITGAGVLSYTNTNPNGGQELFGFSVADNTGLRSNQSVVTISILANDCDATSASCALSQVLSVQVTGTTLTLHQAAQFVTLSGVTLNGQYRLSTGNLQEITVTNARGTAPGWAVTGQVTDFTTTGTPPGSCNTAAGYNRLCIPANNLSWTPSAARVDTPIPGDVGSISFGTAGSATQPWTSPLNGAGSGTTLCSSPVNHSGGTYHCNAGLTLGVPATAGVGTYTGTLTLTLA